MKSIERDDVGCDLHWLASLNEDPAMPPRTSRTFESISNAVRYCCEDLDQSKRFGAWIATDDGRNFTIDQIVEIYAG